MSLLLNLQYNECFHSEANEIGFGREKEQNALYFLHTVLSLYSEKVE